MTILQASSSLVLCLLALPSVAAHGYLAYLGIVDGQSYTNYTGNVPNADPSPSVIRQVSDISPVKGASNPDLNCGLNAQFAQKVASANPGDLLVFDWRGGDNTNWPHNTGPMLTYMTSCGSSDCTQYNSSSSKWFKIAEIGIVTNATSDGSPVWAQQSVMNGAFTNVTLPSTISPGNYLIRHEIIALHLATELGGAEFYPACSQVKVGGSQTGMAKDSEMVLLPGAYTDTDPGIYDPDVYSSNSYTFPGPPIAAFVSAAASSSGSSSSSSTSSATSPASTGSTSGSSSSSGVQSVCKLQRRTESSAESVARRSLKHSSHLPLGIQESHQQKGLRLHSLWGDLVTTFSALRLGGLEIAKGGQSAMY
ncbi:glycosyl hydrolase family 61-domain-containing protein [Lentinula aff. detonsa]|uniref:lytic cellulose monooxygenase (C4-dehydrogenating) n=1 Tax=Lentinula aff. detonsa TaxID=2804958 RepID=A0AA38U8L6_9AGAR|nr:glycosyl hydrolase family 61-domain-containing protein [Lentinula aff. detonsa]